VEALEIGDQEERNETENTETDRNAKTSSGGRRGLLLRIASEGRRLEGGRSHDVEAREALREGKLAEGCEEAGEGGEAM